ncbi:MAG: GerMN domain-containing protein [Smithellaceae bacterium]
MSTKKQRRSVNFKDRKKKKSTRIAYLVAIIAGVVLLLVIFFVILFNALFPPVGTQASKKERQPMEIYFSDAQELFLVAEKRYIFKENDPAKQAGEIVNALLEGSKAGNVNTFPTGVTLHDVRVDKDGVAHVNFSESLLSAHPGGSTAEMATIYSLTNTLAHNVPDIKAVRILVEGRDIQSMKGHISTNKAFRPDPGLLVAAKERNN